MVSRDIGCRSFFQDKFEELLVVTALREIVWSIRRIGLQQQGGGRFIGGFALDGLVEGTEDKQNADSAGMGKESDVYPALARVARVVLREWGLDAPDSVALLVPMAGQTTLHHTPGTDNYNKAVCQQAEFIQRLCLAVTFARKSDDPEAAAAVKAVHAADAARNKAMSTPKVAEASGVLIDDLGDRDPLLDDDHTLPPLVFETLEEGAMRPDVHNGSSSDKFYLYASAQICKSVYLAIQVCVRLCVRVCAGGCVGVWVCGCVGVRVCGCGYGCGRLPPLADPPHPFPCDPCLSAAVSSRSAAEGNPTRPSTRRARSRSRSPTAATRSKSVTGYAKLAPRPTDPKYC